MLEGWVGRLLNFAPCRLLGFPPSSGRAPSEEWQAAEIECAHFAANHKDKHNTIRLAPITDITTDRRHDSLISPPPNVSLLLTTRHARVSHLPQVNTPTTAWLSDRRRPPDKRFEDTYLATILLLRNGPDLQGETRGDFAPVFVRV